MAIAMMVRIFKYKDMTLDDPDSSMTVEQVKDYWASVYPELTQAVIEGPETTAEGIVYEFDKVAGTKGAISVKAVARGCLDNKNPVVLTSQDLDMMAVVGRALGDRHFGAESSLIVPPSEFQEMV